GRQIRLQRLDTGLQALHECRLCRAARVGLSVAAARVPCCLQLGRARRRHTHARLLQGVGATGSGDVMTRMPAFVVHLRTVVITRSVMLRCLWRAMARSRTVWSMCKDREGERRSERHGCEPEQMSFGGHG